MELRTIKVKGPVKTVFAIVPKARDESLVQKQRGESKYHVQFIWRPWQERFLPDGTYQMNMGEDVDADFFFENEQEARSRVVRGLYGAWHSWGDLRRRRQKPGNHFARIIKYNDAGQFEWSYQIGDPRPMVFSEGGDLVG